MIPKDVDAETFLRMPVGFGPGVGPRRNPFGEPFTSAGLMTTAMTMVIASDQELLSDLLPDGVEAATPTFAVTFCSLRNVEWLAGRNYNIVQMTTPCTFIDNSGRAHEADFVNVLWENRADPIITGREELGFAKVYGEIDDVDEPRDGEINATLGWDGHRFLSAKARMLSRVDTAPTVPRSRLHYKYMPATGRWDVPDIAYPVLTPAANPTAEVIAKWEGRGEIEIVRSSFEQLPTLFHIVNTMAALIRAKGAISTVLTITRGGKDLSDQRPIQIAQRNQQHAERQS